MTTPFRLAALSVALLAGTSAAQDATVPGTFPTIQSAVLGATDVDGDGIVHILVMPGTYNENVVVQDRPNRLLEGSGAGSTHVVGNSPLEAFEVRRSNNVTVRGFTISNTGTGDGLEYQGSDFGLIENNVFTSSRDGVTVNRSDFVVVRNNLADGNTQSGIKTQRANDTTIEGNTASNNRTGIDNDRSRRTAIQSNTSMNNLNKGIRDRRSQDAVVEGNTSSANGSDGLFVRESFGTTLRTNTSSGNLQNGLRMRDTTGCLITMNQLVNNTEWGIRRRDWSGDDFGSAAGIQDPLQGDNVVTGNGFGPLRED